ncbi:MAG: ergothioneine biosynthesis glutamate--cysteine ligase EgtA, partial [Gemmatimonadaceae bacterium]
RAGRAGLADAEIRSVAKELSELAIRGCDSLGPDYVSHDDLDIVGEFVDRYSAHGRSPANDS